MTKFIGIDVHKRTTHIVVLDGAKDVVVFDRNVRTKRQRLEEVLAPFAPAKVLIEASTLARWVADLLRSIGFEVVVGNPNNPLMYASRPANRKNDREDARALAVACKAGHYTAVHRTSDAHRELHELLCSRSLVVESRTTFVNRVRALHAGAGLELPSCDAVSFRSTVLRKGVAERVEPAVRPLLEMLAMTEDQLDAMDRRLTRLAEGHAVARLLMTVPGVGPIVALAFVATIDDPSRFGSAHMLESYLGLVPTLHTSGGPGKGGHISKMGSTYLRALLVQSAWALMRSQDPKALPLQQWANALAQRRSTKVAITALARRLAGVLFALWRDGKPFEERPPATPPHPTSAPPIVRRYSLKKARAATPAA